MLTQYRLHLEADRPCAVRNEWAYRLYAALLSSAPHDFGDWLHRAEVTPVSQFLTCEGKPVWTVTLLGERAEETLDPVLAAAEGFRLEKDGVTLRVRERTCRRVDSVEELLRQAGEAQGDHALRFATVTSFKSRGQYCAIPSVRLIVQSLIKKWNGCFEDCPIEDEDGMGMETLAAGLVCARFRLRDGRYFLKGSAIPGFRGTLVLRNRLSGFHRQLAEALLLFSGYSGVGIKTTLGMGGVLYTLQSADVP